METYIALAIIVIIVGLAACYVYRSKKRGAKCIGCPDCKTCASKGCSGCGK